jgi:ubiquinol-cytochrome c reductase cytochrome b subunit
MSTTQTTGTQPSSSGASQAAAATGRFLDDRFGLAKLGKAGLRKVFPDHWSFMLGEIALYSFIILLLTGVFLTLWFQPSMAEVVYNGSYAPLKGVTMSQAYESALHISFDVRGGLVIRQIHHWAALLFMAAMIVHMFRVFFTGAFRKPREFNWLIGIGLLTLGIVEGLFGYSLPDDLLSGTGLRILEGVLLSLPLVGSYLTMFLFGGEFPGHDIIPRLFTIHVLLLPGIFLALITAHILFVVYAKHTQYRGPGREENNVTGYPLLPVYTAKAGGFFFIVFGATTLLSAFATINPIWLYGAYNPTQISAGSQPDWYMGWLEGLLRAFPSWETRMGGFTIPWNVLVPALIIPGILFTFWALYPFLEAWVTGDHRHHHLLDRPRNKPVRTAIGAVVVAEFLIMWANGGNDILATTFDMSINSITWTTRIALFVVPPIVFVVTKRVCLGLQRRDREKVLHGHETGRIVRLPHGEFIEIHQPVTTVERYDMTNYESLQPIQPGPDTDDNGVPAPRTRGERLRARLSRFYFEDRVAPVTPSELRELEGSAHH